MPKPSSSIVYAVKESTTVAISDRARQLQQEGVNVVNLGGGDPDFDTPSHIQEAAINAIKDGFTHYVNSKGTPEIRKAIATKYKGESGLSYDANSEIIATASGKVALYVAFSALVEPGDEVILLEPAWVSYRPIVQLLGGTPVGVKLRFEDGYKVTKEAIQAKVTSKTKAILVNSPNNPTGRVLTAQEMKSIAEVAAENDLWVVTDDIYEKIAYDGRVNVCLAALPGMKERTLNVNGMSKAYAMTGWRLGYIAGPAPIMEEVLKVQQHLVTCAASFTQVAGTAALLGDQECVKNMVREYDRRRLEISAALNGIKGVNCPVPEGAFYFFPKVDYMGMDSMQVSEYLLNEAHVAVTPGIAFGEAGEGCIRLTFATSMENLKEAAKRMKAALS